jgi:hypothetical protein
MSGVNLIVRFGGLCVLGEEPEVSLFGLEPMSSLSAVPPQRFNELWARYKHARKPV